MSGLFAPVTADLVRQIRGLYATGTSRRSISTDLKANPAFVSAVLDESLFTDEVPTDGTTREEAHLDAGGGDPSAVHLGVESTEAGQEVRCISTSHLPDLEQ